jgi:hypothetical protein
MPDRGVGPARNGSSRCHSWRHLNLLAGIISGPDSHGTLSKARNPADLSALLSSTSLRSRVVKHRNLKMEN